MYAALMTGVANHLCTHFEYEPNQVRYGGTDDFWNRFTLEKLAAPGLIYGSTQISFPRGFSAHGAEYLGGTNTSETKGIRVRPIQFMATLTMGMIADNENDHFQQIHKYVEMATFHAKLAYRVQIPGMETIEAWESTISEFTELSPAPSGRETDTYDPEGRLYKLEGSFTLNSQFFVTDEQKLIRCIYVGAHSGGIRGTLGRDQIVGGLISHDSDYNIAPRARK